eukprot:COSAG02_NODE_55_length_43887_cov_30.660364_41_plen_72_part_00
MSGSILYAAELRGFGRESCPRDPAPSLALLRRRPTVPARSANATCVRERGIVRVLEELQQDTENSNDQRRS